MGNPLDSRFRGNDGQKIGGNGAIIVHFNLMSTRHSLLTDGKREILWNALDKTNEKAVGKFLNEITHDVSLPINEMVRNLSPPPCDPKDTRGIQHP